MMKVTDAEKIVSLSRECDKMTDALKELRGRSGIRTTFSWYSGEFTTHEVPTTIAKREIRKLLRRNKAELKSLGVT
jgi:hypothetical protein